MFEMFISIQTKRKAIVSIDKIILFVFLFVSSGGYFQTQALMNQRILVGVRTDLQISASSLLTSPYSLLLNLKIIFIKFRERKSMIS